MCAEQRACNTLHDKMGPRCTGHKRICSVVLWNRNVRGFLTLSILNKSSSWNIQYPLHFLGLPNPREMMWSITSGRSRFPPSKLLPRLSLGRILSYFIRIVQSFFLFLKQDFLFWFVRLLLISSRSLSPPQIKSARHFLLLPCDGRGVAYLFAISTGCGDRSTNCAQPCDTQWKISNIA